MKSGLILGLATAVPAFLVLLIPMGEPTSAIAALVAGIVLSAVCGLLSPTRRKSTWAKGKVLVVWWTVVGILVGVAEGFAAGVFIDVPPGDFLAMMVAVLGSLYLGILGSSVGFVIGLAHSYQLRPSQFTKFSLRSLLLVVTCVAVVLATIAYFLAPQSEQGRLKEQIEHLEQEARMLDEKAEQLGHYIEGSEKPPGWNVHVDMARMKGTPMTDAEQEELRIRMLEMERGEVEKAHKAAEENRNLANEKRELLKQIE
ncbi:hypothetical protein [Bythopirellula polymerisocia]|uniref:Uncharacterized protein n=1 Tax=Bythopirellula polymerisocia TaxID=2528003 RepID=A0A5C6CWX9_9BACT|nr:hypothetical protein [Bythopirellula polymerisocia]TWU29483.1 hypothetical protein Pla144_02610 [Bythopirellula polymerisocia]